MANIELDGPNKKIKVDSGDLTLDVPGDIVLDADGGDVVFADGGTNLLKVTNSSSDVVLQPQVDTKDIVFKQYDGTTVATVEDNATFNIPASKLAIGGTAVTATAAEINLIDGGTARGTTAIADGDGVLINDAGTMRQTTVETLKTYIGGFDVSSITGATALDDVPATTDEFIISDGGTLKRIDANFLMNTPCFYAYKTANTTFANSTNVTLVPTSIVTNDGTSYDSSNGRFTCPAGQDGTYFFYAHFRINNYDPNRTSIAFFVNGSETNWSLHEHAPEGDLSGRRPTIHATAIKALSATDYIEAKGLQISGSDDTVTNLGFGGFKIR